MKPKNALFALPPLLGVVMWRAAHPPLTKETLEMRALMKRSLVTNIKYFSKMGVPATSTTLSKAEFAPFIEGFYLTPKADAYAIICEPQRGVINIQCQLPPDKRYPLRKKEELKVSITIAVAEGQGQATAYYPAVMAKRNDLQRVTVKRWMKLLLANPRIGPDLPGA